MAAWPLLISICGCFQAEGVAIVPKQDETTPTIEAAVISITPRVWPTMVRSHGNVTPDDRAVVGSRIEGRVDTVHVDIGDTVERGAALVTLSQSEFRLRVQQAEAQLLQARSAVGLRPGTPVSELDPESAPPVLEQKATLKEAQLNLARATQLRERNSISATELEQVEAAVAVTEARYRSALNSVHEKMALIGVREAELSLAKEDLANTVIVAPFEGVIQERTVSPGTYMRIGDPAISVVRLHQLRFRGSVPERFAMQLAVGQTLQLQIESVASPVTATVSRISPAVSAASRSLQFEAVVNNADGQLRSGLFAEARIVIDADAMGIAIPSSALVEFAGAQKVWKVTDGMAREQSVLTGEHREDRIQILSGLNFGDIILLDGSSGEVANVEVIDSPAKTEPANSNEAVESETVEKAVEG